MILKKWPAVGSTATAIVLFGMVMLCFIWAWLYHIIQTERQIEVDKAFKETATYSRMFEEHTVRTIRGLDQIALFLKYQAEKDGLKINLLRLMKEERFAGQPILQLGVADEVGNLTASSILPIVLPNIADREHFQVHRDADSKGLFISKPLIGRTSGKWSIQLTRRVNKTDGSFGGVVVVSVDPYYFAEFYKQVDLGKDASISLIGRDGTLRVRKSGDEVSVGLDFSQRVQKEFAGGYTGQYTDKSIVDGIRRFFSYRILGEYPLIVAVGMPESMAYGGLDKRISGYYWACSLMSALILVFIGILLIGIARRKRTEQALRESEERFRTYFRDNKSVMLLVDRETASIVDANPAAADYYGYPLERLAQMKIGEINMLSPDDITAKMQQASSRQNNAFVFPHRLASGDIRHVEVYSTPIHVGKREKLLSIIHDVTERVQLETRNKEREENFHNFFNSIDEFLFVLDAQGCILRVNQPVLDRLEYSMDELAGQSVLVVHPEKQREEAARTVQQMLAGEADACMVPLIGKSGELVPVETRVTAGRWNGQPALFGVSKDLSALKISEEKLNKVFQTTSALMVLSTLEEGIILDANSAFLNVLGYAKYEVIGKRSVDLDIFESAEVRKNIRQRLREDGFIRNQEVRFRTKSGGEVVGLLSVSIVDVAAHRLLITTVSDITALKQAEQKLERSAQTQMVLKEIAEAALASDSLKELYETIHRLVIKVLPAENFHLSLVDESNSEIVDEYSSVNAKNSVPRRRPVGIGLTEYALKHGKTIHITKMLQEQLWESGEAVSQNYSPIHEWLGAPLFDSTGRAFGVMAVVSKSEALTFAQGDADVLSIIAAQVSMAIERKRSEELIRSGRERYHALMEQSFEALALVDSDTQEAVEVNRRFTELFGYSLPEDAPLYVNQFVVDSQSNLDRIYKEELRQQGFVAPAARIFRHKNGTEVHVERAETIIKYEGRDLYLASMRDMTAERRRAAELVKDVNLARRVQQDLLPKIPSSPFFDIRTLYYPSNAVSGDSYQLAWRVEGKLLRGFLVDVSGHGLGTALQTASINSLLQEDATAKLPLMGQLRRLNARASKYFSDGAYAAMLGFELDLSARELRYVGAGITQFFANGQKIEVPGMFIGLWETAEFTAGVIPLKEGDCFYFLTDGFADALAQPEHNDFWSPGGREFEADVAALERLAAGGTLRDDATGVCLKVLA